MLLIVAAVFIAVGVSLLRGGRFEHARSVRLPLVSLLGLALVAQGLLHLAAPALAGTVALLLVALAGVLAFGICNWHRRGMPLFILGFTLNAVVILANGGMPVAREAILLLGGDPASLTGLHHVMTSQTSLGLLGDIIPLQVTGSIFSIGDVLIAAAMLPLVHDLMSPTDRSSLLEGRLARTLSQFGWQPPRRRQPIPEWQQAPPRAESRASSQAPRQPS